VRQQCADICSDAGLPDMAGIEEQIDRFA